MKKLLLLLLSISSLFGYQHKYTDQQAIDDFIAGNKQKYYNDNLVELNNLTLTEKGILKHGAGLENNLSRNKIAQIANRGLSISKNINCNDVIEGDFSATIYEILPESGMVRCMVAQKDDLYNPLGYFTIRYPKMKEFFTRDYSSTDQDISNALNESEQRFDLLFKTKNLLKTHTNTDNYLNIPELILASILTDNKIIDMRATGDTGKLQLKSGYTSSYTVNNATVDNSDYIVYDAANMFKNYKDIADLSMYYLMLVALLFGVWGIGGAFIRPVADKFEDQQNYDKKIPYIAGILFGILFFIPTADEQAAAQQNQQNYEIMHSKFQDFERFGYYLFSDWATEIAQKITDNEIGTIIKKANLGSKEQLKNTHAGRKLYEKLSNFEEKYQAECATTYDTTILMKLGYSEDKNNPYAVSENWTYASSVFAGNGATFYLPLKDGGLVIEDRSALSEEEKVIVYPKLSISSCGKSFYKEIKYQSMYKDYHDSFERERAASMHQDYQNKIEMVKTLIEFQYELQKDYGYLSILGLPVTKMQTEMIGGLYSTKDSVIFQKMNEEIQKDSWRGHTHSILSSIPYLFVPGAGTVYNALSGAIKDVKAGFESSVAGKVGGVLGLNIGTGLIANIVGFDLAYQVSKTLLQIAPIIGIIVIGLLRFGIIIVKIFAFHFASLLILPIMFAKENVKSISAFTMKIFATMVELPMFVLAVWLAMTANNLLHSIGDAFGKRIIIGMLENNEKQMKDFSLSIDGLMEFFSFDSKWIMKLKIYMFDGFMEVAIAIFSIVIIYKIIITLHSAIFEVIEVHSSQSLDNAIESMKNEASGWGTRV